MTLITLYSGFTCHYLNAKVILKYHKAKLFFKYFPGFKTFYEIGGCPGVSVACARAGITTHNTGMSHSKS